MTVHMFFTEPGKAVGGWHTVREYKRPSLANSWLRKFILQVFNNENNYMGNYDFCEIWYGDTKRFYNPDAKPDATAKRLAPDSGINGFNHGAVFSHHDLRRI